MGFLTILVIALVAYTLVKNSREKNAPQASGTVAASEAAAVPEEAAPVSPKVEAPIDTAFMTGLQGYFHSNWAKDGAIYADLDNLPISCFTVQLQEDRVMESITLEGQNVPLVNETNYDTLCPAAEIPDLTTPAQQQAVFAKLAAYLVSLGTLTRKEDAFYPLRTVDGPESKPEAAASNRSDSAKCKGDDYDALCAQMQSILDQMSKDKQTE